MSTKEHLGGKEDVPCDDFLGEQELRNFLHVLLVCCEELRCPLLSSTSKNTNEHKQRVEVSEDILNHLSDLSIKHLTCLLAEWLGEALLLVIPTTIADRADNVVQAVVRHSLERKLRNLLQIILRAGRDVGLAEENLLCDATAKSHAYPVDHLRDGEEVAVWWKVLRSVW